MNDLADLQKPPVDADFLRIFNRLCVALREQSDKSGITQGVYFDALKDLPITALMAGATMLAKDQGRRFFPTTGEWRAAAETAYQQQLRDAVQPARDEPWHLDCEACEDTGWTAHECDGGGASWPEDSEPKIYRAQERTAQKPRIAMCGRPKSHQPHSYAQICGCRATNRTYQRHQRFGSGS